MFKIKIKKVYYYVISLLLIFFLCFLLLRWYLRIINPKLLIVANDYLKKDIYENISLSSTQFFNEGSIMGIVKIYKNKNDEIVYTTYDMQKCYYLLNKIANSYKDNMPLKNYFFKVPLFVFSDNILISNKGPMIKVFFDYLGMSLANLRTKVTNYGINNALIELYIEINIEGRIITPVSRNNTVVKYDMLVSSMVINGRVPSFYGREIKTNSELFNIPISF